MTKIKVNQVRAADRSINVDMNPLDGGNFLPYLKVEVSANIQNTSLSSSGTAPAPPQSVTVAVSFGGAAWVKGSSLDYTITAVYLSSDNVNWELFTGTLVDGSGTAVVLQHLV